MTTVLLVDDHPLFLDGVRAALTGAPDVEVVGEAHDCREAVEVSRTRARERPNASSIAARSDPLPASVAVSRNTRLLRARYHGVAIRSMACLSRFAGSASTRL